ncbi:MAG: RNA polymerase sigma factor [Ruminococcus sp.]|nr:RNA polymerase sigma factor [Ruminococcus sp.]
MSERQLVLKAKTGDKNAFCELYTIYKDKLYRYAYYRLTNENDAKDAVSDCIVSSFEQISSLKKAEAFSSWIFRILYCSCNKYINNQVQNRQSVNFSDIANSYHDNAKMEIKTEVMHALEYLNEDEKNIVILSVFGGLKSKDIAQIMNMTSGSVRSKLSRSLTKMRTFLE